MWSYPSGLHNDVILLLLLWCFPYSLHNDVTRRAAVNNTCDSTSTYVILP